MGNHQELPVTLIVRGKERRGGEENNSNMWPISSPVHGICPPSAALLCSVECSLLPFSTDTLSWCSLSPTLLGIEAFCISVRVDGHMANIKSQKEHMCLSGKSPTKHHWNQSNPIFYWLFCCSYAKLSHNHKPLRLYDLTCDRWFR